MPNVLVYSAASFEEQLTDIVSSFFRSTKSSDQAKPSEIERAESRLTCNFPLIVQRYSSVLGNARDINESYYHIMSPSQIQIVQHENQRYFKVASSYQEISWFGVAKDTDSEDPKVFEFTDDNPALAFELASSFYCFTLLWQIINDLAAFRATAYPKKSTIKQIRLDSVALKFSKNNTGDLKFSRQGPCLVLHTTEGQKDLVSIAGRERETVTAFCEKYHLNIVRLRERR